MPMVVMKEGVKESSLKRRRQQDLPTPESPISSSLICSHELKIVGYEWSGALYQKVIVPRPSHCRKGGENLQTVAQEQEIFNRHCR